MRQGPQPDAGQDQRDGRRDYGVLDGVERILLQRAQEADVHGVPKGTPKQLVGDDFRARHPPAMQQPVASVAVGLKNASAFYHPRLTGKVWH